tara:strand:+ start:1342 stop:5151 length:3810 start_codon:yes stop_codon:yes gene_type:complete
MDFRSDTFQQAHKELSSMQNLDKSTVVSFLQSKNINVKDFKEANKNYKSFLKEGKTIQPEGTRFGRIGTRLFGEVGADVRDLASMVAPKTVEAIGDFIPDPVKDHVNRMFDPYMGEGLGSDISRGTADIGSFFVPGAQVLKVYKAGKALTGVKGATAIGKKAFKKRRIVRNAERGVATAAGFTISENSADENQYNAMLDIADELGGEGQSGLTKALKRFAVDENDSEAVQKINSFGLNLLAVPMFAGLAVIKNPLEKAKAIKKIADRAAKAKQQKLAIDVIPTTALGKAADKVGIRNLLFRGFGTTRGTDRFTLNRILKNEAAVKKTMKEVDGLSQDLTKAVNNSSSSLNKNELSTLVNGVLDGEAGALKKLLQEDPNVARIAREMTKNIRDSRRPLAGRMKNAKLKAMYDPDKNKVWLNRTYRIHDDPSFSREIKDIPTDVRAGVENYLRTKLKIPEDQMVPAIKKLLERGNLSEQTIGQVFNPFRKTGSSPLGSSSKVYKKRTELAQVPAIRALWGEVKDPHKNYFNSMVKLSKMEADASLLDDMANYLKTNNLAKTAKQIENRTGPIVGDIADFEEGILAQRNIKEAVKKGKDVSKIKQSKVVSLEDFGSNKLKSILGADAEKNILNPLKGLYANKNYRNFLEEGTDVMAPTNVLMKNWMRYKVATQTSKTIYNPGTHGRNTMGNMVLMIANGMNPFRLKTDSFKGAAEKLTGKSNKELGKRLGRYQELNITDSGVKQEIIRRSANQVFNFDAKTIGAKLSKGMQSKANPFKAAQNLYQVEDDFFKIMHFEKTIDDLKKVFPKGTSIDVIEEEAARRTRDLMPNYNLVGRSLKKARALPVGDFMAFPAEMVRITKNLTRDTWDDIAGNTAARLGIKNKEAQKKLRGMGYRRLAGMTAAATAGTEAMNFSANLLGITGEDQDAIERLQPVWEQGTDKIYLSGVNKDKNNHFGIDYINMGPIDPFSFFKAPVVMLAGELADIGDKFNRTGNLNWSEDSNRRLISSMKQMAGPFGGTSMSTEGLMKAYKVFDNDKLNYKQQIAEGASIIGKTILPGGVNTYLKQQKYRKSKDLRKGMYNSNTGEYEDRGAVSDYDYTIPEVEMEGLLSKFKWLGVRPQRLDITAGLRRNIIPLTKSMDDTTNQKNFMTNPNSPRDSAQRNKEFMNAYKKDQTYRLGKQRDLKKLVNAYDDLGLDYEDILSGLSREFLKDVNSEDIITKMDFSHRNKFLPSFIPEGQIPEAEVYTGGPLPYDEVGNLYEQLFQYNLTDED